MAALTENTQTQGRLQKGEQTLPRLVGNTEVRHPSQSQTVLLMPHTGYQEVKKEIIQPPLLHSSSLAPNQHLCPVQ